MNRKRRYGHRLMAVLLGLIMMVSCLTPVMAKEREVQLPSEEAIQAQINRTAAWEMNTVTDPGCGSIGGEWTVMGLARSKKITDSFRSSYLANLRMKLDSCQGVLDQVKYTEYARVTLAVTSLGMDAGDVFGYNMLEKLADYDKVSWQGTNSLVYALLALDSRKYTIPAVETGKNQTTRDNLIAALLREQSNRGGWGLDRSSPEPDVTAMALQALAPYRDRAEVNTAVEKALSWLGTVQNEDGSFSLEGEATAESCAQTVTALATLKISPKDVRFVKNNLTVLDALLCFGNDDGSFSHVRGGEANPMATDQALYALTAYWRYTKDMTSLYDMTDEFNGSVESGGSGSGESGGSGSDATDDDAELEAKIQDLLERVNVVSAEPYLSELQEIIKLQNELESYSAFDGQQEAKAKLLSARQYIDDVQKQVDALDQEIWQNIDPLRLSLKNQEQVTALLNRYMALRIEDRTAVLNRQDLEDAHSVQESLKAGVIPARIFENQLSTGEEFIYEGKAGNYSYTMIFQAADIHAAGDMNAGVSLKNSSGVKLPDGAFGFRLNQTGTLAGKMTFTMTGAATSGTYTLYHMNSGTGKWSSPGQVKVDSKKTFSCTLSVGGDYCIVPVEQKNTQTQTTTSKNTGTSSSRKKIKTVEISNMVEASVTDGIIPASEFKKVQGEDKNLTFTCEAKDSALKSTSGETISYTLIFNGQDVEQPIDFDTGITSDPENKEQVELLAEQPWILAFAQKEFPGAMLVTVKTDLEDGEYLLCRYDEEQEKAELIRKVSIEEGKLQTVFAQGGTCFLAKKVSTKTVSELQKGAENTDTEEHDTAAENELISEADQTEDAQSDLTENIGEGSQSMAEKLILPVLWLLCIVGQGIVLLVWWKMKKGGTIRDE